MKALVVGETAVAASVAETLAKSAEVFSIMQRKNPTIKRIAIKYMILKRVCPEIVGTWAITDMVDMAVIASRRYISRDIASALELAGITAIAPTKESTEIEWDKIRAINFMDSINAKFPPSIIISNREEIDEKIDKAEKEFGDFVIKPSYYTEGKGTKFYKEDLTKAKAKRYIKEILKKGKAILEKRLYGKTISVQAFSDGHRVSLMPPVEVVKRYKNKTSQGFLSYSDGADLGYLTGSDMDEIRKVFQRTVNRLRLSGREFKGILGIEFIKDRMGKVWTIGFNSTFTDPGTINNMANLKTELVEILWSIIDENLKKAVFRAFKTSTIYGFPKGYPTKPLINKRVEVDGGCIWKCGGKLIYHSLRTKGDKMYTTKSRSIAVINRVNEKEEIDEKIKEIKRCTKGLEFYSTSSKRGAK